MHVNLHTSMRSAVTRKQADTGRSRDDIVGQQNSTMQEERQTTHRQEEVGKHMAAEAYRPEHLGLAAAVSACVAHLYRASDQLEESEPVVVAAGRTLVTVGSPAAVADTVRVAEVAADTGRGRRAAGAADRMRRTAARPGEDFHHARRCAPERKLESALRQV